MKTDINETTLSELAKQERRNYHKLWRAKNPEKVKQMNENFWKKRALKKLENRGVNQ